MGHIGQRRQVGHGPRRVTDYLRVEKPGVVIDLGGKGVRIITIHEPSIDTKATQRGIKHGVGTAVQGRGSHEVGT